MLEIGKRIKERREQLGMTQDELAVKTGYKDRSSITKIERGGNNLPQTKIAAFAKALDTTPDFLMGWTQDEPQDTAIFEKLPQYGIRRVPIFESVSAGLGAYASSDIIGYTPISAENSCDEMFAIKVKGSSMFPKIEDGDLVVVRKQPIVDNGQVAVILIDGDDGVVKQFFQDNPDTVRLHSFNPEYQDRYFIEDEINRLRIVGLVKQVIKIL